MVSSLPFLLKQQLQILARSSQELERSSVPCQMFCCLRWEERTSVDTATYYIVVFHPLLIAIRQVILGQELCILGSEGPAKRQMGVFSQSVDCIVSHIYLSGSNKSKLTLGRIISQPPTIPDVGILVHNDIQQSQSLASSSGTQSGLPTSNHDTVEI